MQPSDIKLKHVYTGVRWKGAREVILLERGPNKEQRVHFVDQRTGRTGHAPLSQFAASAQSVVST